MWKQFWSKGDAKSTEETATASRQLSSDPGGWDLDSRNKIPQVIWLGEGMVM